MNLREATKALVSAPDVAMQLRVVDQYIQTYNKLPSKFVLPYEHVALKPIIEAFAKDLKAFVAYIKALRDACEGERYFQVHDLYRTISLRALQQERRLRITRATELLLGKAEQVLGRPLTVDDRARLGRALEQRWGALRLEFLREARSGMTDDKLTAFQRDEALAEFWQNIERGLDNGVVTLGGNEDEYIRRWLA